MEKRGFGPVPVRPPVGCLPGKDRKISTCTIAQLQGENARDFDNQTVTLVCTVVKNKIMTTKSNTLMAFTTIEDLTGTMELLVFPRVLTSCRAYLQENAVVVTTGRASVKEDEGTRLIVESVLPVDGYDPSQSFGQNRSQRIGAAAGIRLPKAYGCWCPRGNAPRCTRWKTCCKIFLTAPHPYISNLKIPASGCVRRKVCGPWITRCCARSWNASWVLTM